MFSAVRWIAVLFVVATAAEAASPCQFRLLRGIGRAADNVPGPKGTARRARHIFDAQASAPGRGTVVLATDGKALRMFTSDGPEGGRSFPTLEEVFEHLDGFDLPVDIALDVEAIDEGLLTEVIAREVPASILVADGRRLPVRSVSLDGQEVPFAEIAEGVLVELESAELFVDAYESLSQPFTAEEVVVFDALNGVARGPSARRAFADLDGWPVGSWPKLVEALAAHPREAVLILASPGDDGLQLSVPPVIGGLLSGPTWESLVHERAGPVIVLGCGGDDGLRIQDIDRALTAADVGDFLRLLSRGPGLVLVDVAPGPDEPAWRLDECGPSLTIQRLGLGPDAAHGPVTIARLDGVSARGVTAPPPWFLMPLLLGVLGLMFGSSVGEILAWPLRFDPVSYRWLKLTALGALPTMALGDLGLVVLVVAGIGAPILSGVGWLVSRPFRFNPLQWSFPKFALCGLVPLLLLVAAVELGAAI